MFESLGAGRPCIRRHHDKVAWTQSLEQLIQLRATGTIGAVIDLIKRQAHMHLPEPVLDREQRLADAGPEPVDGESRRIAQLPTPRDVASPELTAMAPVMRRAPRREGGGPWA